MKTIILCCLLMMTLFGCEDTENPKISETEKPKIEKPVFQDIFPEFEPEPEINPEDLVTGFSKCRPYYVLIIKANRYYWGHDDYIAATMAQMYTESACDRFAKSWVGAEGLLQFMPRTAAGLQLTAKCDIGINADPYNLKWITMAGVCYNKYLYNRNYEFPLVCDRYAAAMSAYNGGQKYVNVKREKCSGGCDATKWFNNVEYMATRRKPSNEHENRQYPHRVLKKFTPKFIESGYIGKDLCIGR